MRHRVAHNEGFGRVSLIVLAVLVASIVIGTQRTVAVQTTQRQAVPQNPAEGREAFEVASVRTSNPAAVGGGRGGGSIGGCGGGVPRIDGNRFAVTNTTLYTLITWAYGMGECLNVSALDQLSGGPAWVRSDGFDIQALMPEGSPNYTFQQLRTANAPKLALMIKALLADRFKLALHPETREIPVYSLTVAKGGPKLQRLEEGSCTVRPPMDLTKPLPRPPSPDEKAWCGFGSMFVNSSQKATADVRAMTLDEFSKLLSPMLDRPVINKTGIAAIVAFHMEFAFEQSASRLGISLSPGAGPGGAPGAASSSDAAGPSIFTAIQEQLGLKLDPTRGPGQFLVIDHVERPTAN